jgi:glutamate dehydrogenase (NAD(P)+)
VLPDILLNSGGVTVSYFEYVKNLGHIAPGKLTKRWETKSKELMFKAINDLLAESGSEVAEDHLMEGANEKDLVHSGLEEVMCEAVAEIKKLATKKDCSLRMATYAIAL